MNDVLERLQDEMRVEEDGTVGIRLGSGECLVKDLLDAADEIRRLREMETRHDAAPAPRQEGAGRAK